MEQEQYIKELNTVTGLTFGQDYGFILGTHAPFDIVAGMYSGSNFNGYKVWRHNPKGRQFGGLQIEVPVGSDNQLQTVINFLKKQ